MFNLSLVKQPSSFKEVIQHPKWIEAINKELDALIENQTWVITDLSLHKKLIGCKWIFKVKLNADGTVERYKACLVAK